MATATRSQAPRKSTRSQASRAPRKSTRSQATRRKVAYAVASVGVAVLSLSVVHCTQSLSLLTGSPLVLSALLAIGIDAGMIACEIADITTHTCDDAATIKRWAFAYIIIAVVVSMILNAIGSAMHATPDMKAGSYLIGAMIPLLSFILGRVAGHLYNS